MQLHGVKNTRPETTGCAQFCDTETVIAVERNCEAHAWDKRRNIRAIVQPAQRVHGAGDQGGQLLRVGAASFMHHAGINADQAGFRIGVAKAVGRCREARKGGVQSPDSLPVRARQPSGSMLKSNF